VDLINYGSISRDSFRIYIEANSIEEMKEIFETAIHVFSEDITDEQLQETYSKVENRNGVSFLMEWGISGYYEKHDSLYKMMVDFEKMEVYKK